MGFLHVRALAEEAATVTHSAESNKPSLEQRVDAIDRSNEAAAAARRLREGTRLKNCVGRFRQNGDSVSFVDEQGRDMGGLPNLNLERVVRMLKGVDEPENITWSISGSVTEFSGRNYVLITRAVYKAAAAPPAPDLVAD